MDRYDVCFLLGGALIATGLFLWDVRIGCIGTGIGLCALAYLAAARRAPVPSPSVEETK